MSAMRIADGYKVKKYQLSLINIEPYRLKTSDIPQLGKATWIGRGFEHTDIEAQRVWDAGKGNLKKYLQATKSSGTSSAE